MERVSPAIFHLRSKIAEVEGKVVSLGQSRDMDTDENVRQLRRLYKEIGELRDRVAGVIQEAEHDET